MVDSKKSNARKLKLSGIIIGIVFLILQHLIYSLGHVLAGFVGITPILPKIPAIDDAIPIVSIFILPYIWSYVYWAIGPMAVSKCDQKHYKNFLVACGAALLAGMLVLIFVPTYMDRVAEGLYVSHGNSIFEKLRQFWYSLDGGNMAYNLFPSFHCLNSTLCYLGVMGRKEIPRWFRIYTLIMAILIYLATVFVKQHFFLDVVSGIAIAIIFFALAKKFNWGRIIKFNI